MLGSLITKTTSHCLLVVRVHFFSFPDQLDTSINLSPVETRVVLSLSHYSTKTIISLPTRQRTQDRFLEN